MFGTVQRDICTEISFATTETHLKQTNIKPNEVCNIEINTF